MKNYYIILGISSTATPDQIKAAYRRQAKDLHPDHYGEDCEPFRQVQEAYSVLIDPGQRKVYDDKLQSEKKKIRINRETERPQSRHEPEPLIPVDSPSRTNKISITDSCDTFMPSFDAIFERLWRNFRDVHHPKSEHPESLQVEVTLYPDQAKRGGTVEIMVPAEIRCPACDGYGGIGFYECYRCQGSGRIIGEFPVNVRFPAGILYKHIVEIQLDHLGIHNYYMTVIFRVDRDE
jgi:DnaJ-class molecular chaperone